jgi:hypothetical protein
VPKNAFPAAICRGHFDRWLSRIARYAGSGATFGNFLSSIVNWLTFARTNPGDDAAHRKAEANFNFRGWQGR